MSESKSTPGPWRVVPRDGNRHRHNDIMSGNKRVASIGESTIGSLRESAANARLIAAAPDLLEACVRLLRFNEELCADMNVSTHYPSADYARKAIAKAEGE